MITRAEAERDFLVGQCQKLVCKYIDLYPSGIVCGICAPCMLKDISTKLDVFTDEWLGVKNDN